MTASHAAPFEPAPPRRANDLADRLEITGQWVTGFAVLGMLASVVAGVAVALITTDSTDTFGDPSKSHPFVVLGAAIAVAGIFQSLLVLMLAFWARLYGQTVIRQGL